MINPRHKFRNMGVPQQQMQQAAPSMLNALGKPPMDPNMLAPPQQGGGMGMAQMLAMKHLKDSGGVEKFGKPQNAPMGLTGGSEMMGYDAPMFQDPGMLAQLFNKPGR